jgi:hypothetical protein
LFPCVPVKYDGIRRCSEFYIWESHTQTTKNSDYFWQGAMKICLQIQQAVITICSLH